MASTLTLQDSINFVTPILKNQPLMVSNMQPALMAGNIALQTMLGPPMRWRTNRKEINFSISQAGGTDYIQSVSPLGWIETQWLVDSAGNYRDLNGAISLAVTGDNGRPDLVAPQFDDNNGNITFRFNKTPDANYTAFIDFQGKAPLLTSAASQFAPVSDEFMYIYNHFFLALMSLLVNDSRFPIFENYAISRLLGAQDGLSQQARDIFLGNWANVLATMQRSQAEVNSGVAGRSR